MGLFFISGTTWQVAQCFGNFLTFYDRVLVSQINRVTFKVRKSWESIIHSEINMLKATSTSACDSLVKTKPQQ